MVNITEVSLQDTLVGEWMAQAWGPLQSYDPIKQAYYSPSCAPSATSVTLDKGDQGYDTLRAVFAQCAEPSIKSHFGGAYPEGVCVDTSLKVLRYEAGDYVREHTDNGGEVFEASQARRAIFTCLLYLSASEVKGGELQFPELSQSVPCKHGTLVVFEAGLRHKVTPIVSGSRFAVVFRVWAIRSLA